jgi:mRNA interferase RelE/StbE
VSWDYELTDNARKNLRDLGPSAEKKVVTYLKKRIKGATNPRALGKPLRGELAGLWRYRVEDYRILARIEDRRLIVTVVTVGHRRDVYE